MRSSYDSNCLSQQRPISFSQQFFEIVSALLGAQLYLSRRADYLSFICNLSPGLINVFYGVSTATKKLPSTYSFRRSYHGSAGNLRLLKKDQEKFKKLTFEVRLLHSIVFIRNPWRNDCIWIKIEEKNRTKNVRITHCFES